MNRCRYDSPIGPLLLESDGQALVAVKWQEESAEEQMDAVLEQTVQWLNLYFQGKNPQDFPPMQMEGTAFQLKVWEMLRQIPYGQTVSYGDLAKKLSPTMSSQAIGGAVHRNPIAILVPCHRVIGSNGKLVGYAYGVDKKSFLLHLEKE